MFQVLRTRFALSLAVMAIAGMSVAPAYAAPGQGQGGPAQAPRPPEAQPSVIFQPDLRVTERAEPYFRQYNQTWVYRFKVTNIGAASSGAIALKGVCQYTNPNDDLMNHTVLAKVIGGLLPDHSANVDVVCDRTTDILADAKLTASTQNDLDTSNNSAISQ